VLLIDAKLDEIRRRLIDLTRNNRLLNHRARGKRTLRVVDELPAEVYRILVDETRVMQFLSREEAAEEVREHLPLDDSDALVVTERSQASPGAVPVALPLAPIAGNGAVADRHRDSNLQTLLSNEKLQTRLVHLAREANSALEEQGCNILYLTLGIIEWREANESSVKSRAPVIFVPVELRRKTVNTRYTVQLFDDDIVANSSLIELCQTQFHFGLPAFDAEKDKVSEYFARVQQMVAGLEGWQFLSEIHLGLFSFSKLLMYRDLDPGSWPEESRISGNPIIQCLSGLSSGDSHDDDGIPSVEHLDEIVKPSECFQVVDADSSQQQAILAAKRGLNVVIDGPPGTGKSQTITNVIAECLAAGRTVLFVSEKAAALEVVKRNLERRDLADFALELHSRQASKKAVLSEFHRVLEKQAIARKVSPEKAEELARIRDQLNTYRRELHEPLGQLNISPFEAISRAIGLRQYPETDCELPEVMSWTVRQLAEADQQLQTLDRRIVRVGDPLQHPWRGVGLRSVGLTDRRQVVKSAEELIAAIRELLDSTASLASQLSRVAPLNIRDASELLAAAKTVLETPAELAPAVNDDRWNSTDPQLQNWLELGQRRQRLRQSWAQIFDPKAEHHDWQDVLDRCRRHGRSILRVFRPSWYSDKKRILRFLMGPGCPSIDRQIESLAALLESANLRRQIEPEETKFGSRFGVAWHGLESDWDALSRYAAQALAVRQLVGAGRVDAVAAARIINLQHRHELASSLNSAQTASGRKTHGVTG
jgi:hypothetical protein